MKRLSRIDTVWFHVVDDNRRSRRTVEKLGAVVARTVVTDAGLTAAHYRLGRPA